MLASPRPALLAATLTLALAPLGACGDDPAPAPAPAAPEDFDDPFADEVENAAAPEPPAQAEPEALPADAPPTAEPAPADAVEAESDGTEPAPEPAGADAKTATADEPAVKPTSTRSKRPAKPAESGKDAKAETEAKPEPEPEPEPAAKEEAKVVEARPAAETKPPPPPQARLAGEYRYVGGAAQKQRLADTIDQTVQQLNALIRNIGRRRLTESNQVRDAIKIAVDGERVTTTFVPGGTVTATLGGPQVDWTTDTGSKVKVKMSLVKGRLVQDFKGEDGSRRNVFTVDSSGDTMTMSVTISSSRLTTPMKYALSYKRK